MPTQVPMELMTRKDLASKVLHVDVNTADKRFLYEPDFPFVMVGTQRRYYLPAVHEWLMKHQMFND